MTKTQNLITKEGLKKLKNTIENLKNIERPLVIKDIAEARSHGDLKENSEYVSAKEKQAFIEGKIHEYEQLLASVEPFNSSTVVNKDEIRFGAKCILESVEGSETKHIQIVSSFEADFSKGLIAIDAPVAKILLGKKLNEEVEMLSKGKKQHFKIKKITY